MPLPDQSKIQWEQGRTHEATACSPSHISGNEKTATLEGCRMCSVHSVSAVDCLWLHGDTSTKKKVRNGWMHQQECIAASERLISGKLLLVEFFFSTL